MVGQTLALNGNSYRIVGILRKAFNSLPRGGGVVGDANPTTDQASRRFMHWLNIIARLKRVSA